MKVRFTYIICLLLIALTACSQSVSNTETTGTTPSSSQIQETNVPALTPSPTELSTPNIPVEVGSQLPISDQSFSNDNISKVQEIGVVYNGQKLAQYTTNLEELFIGDESGISVYKMKVISTLVPVESSVFKEIFKLVPFYERINFYAIPPRINDDHSFNASDLSISADGSHFSVVTHDGIQVYDREGNLSGELQIPDTEFKIVLSTDGTFEALVYNDTVHILNVLDGSTVLETEGTEARFTNDGNYVAVRKRMAIYLYSTTDWAEVYTFPQNPLADWAISIDSQAIATSVDDDLVIHNLSDGELAFTINRYLSDQDRVAAYLFMVIPYMDKSLLDEDHIEDFWDYLDDSKYDALFSDFNKSWKREAIEQSFYTTSEGTVLINSMYVDELNNTHTETCMILPTLDLVCNSVNIIMDSNDNIFTESSSKSSFLEIGKLNPEAKETNDIFSSYDSVNFAEDTNFMSYRIKAINLQKQYFIGNYKYNNRVVDSNTGEVLNSWKEDINHPIFSPNSEYIAFLYSDVNSGGPYRVGYYDYANNQFQLLHYETRPSSFAFTNDSTKLLGIENEATQNSVDKIISYALGTEEVIAETVAEFVYQDYPEMGRLSSLAISPADDIILVGTDKGYVLAYDMQNGTLLHQWQAHENGSVMAVAFSRDGKTIYTSNEYGEIKVWGSQPLNWD